MNSISASFVFFPKLKRIEALPKSELMPMAAKTWLGLGEIEVQADPELTATF
ncbi:hypothetical protein [Algoriphagus boritolerans]|uniref:hypothetical protein n=1 Tax=Algoriphagus boritolerans TaxID=308111 RepID=UPI002FCE1DC9